VEKIRGIFERPRGSGVWGADFRDGSGRRVRELAGSKPAAIRLRRTREDEVKRGEYVPRCSWTFARLAREAMAEKSLRARPATVESNRLRLDKLLPRIGHSRVARLTPARIEELLGELKRGRVLSNSTVNLYRSLLSSIFSHGVKLGLIPANPIEKVEKYPENPPRTRYLSDEEEARLRKEFVQDSHEWEFHLALYAGMRRGEQFFLRWADVDLEINRAIAVGKTGPRTVEINSEARLALLELQKISGARDFVCPDNDGSAERDWRRWFEVAVKAAGIQKFHYHDVRHTFASRALKKGATIREVQELLGHKTLKMTERYLHISPSHLTAAAEKMVEAKK
jgi:integrase